MESGRKTFLTPEKMWDYFQNSKSILFNSLAADIDMFFYIVFFSA